MAYTRDPDNDLVWDETTETYVLASSVASTPTTSTNSIMQEISIKDAVYDIQGKSIENKNTANTSVNSIYNWVGTLQEYNDQNVGTNHPDWICFITDDVAGGESVYTKSEVDDLITALANKLGGSTFTSIQYYATEAEAQAASAADPNKLCLFPV